MSGWYRIEIEEFDVVVAGIVITANEPGVLGNVDPFFSQPVTHFLSVSHCGKKPCIRPASPTSACAAIMSRLMWIIQAAGAVAQDYHQTCETAHQAGRAQNARHSFHFFVRSETHQQAGY